MTRFVDVIGVLGIALFLASAAWQGLVLLPASAKYRTDLKPGEHFGRGSSRWWQINVFNRNNYRSNEGRKFFRTLLVAVAIQFTGLVLLFISAFVAMG